MSRRATTRPSSPRQPAVAGVADDTGLGGASPSTSDDTGKISPAMRGTASIPLSPTMLLPELERILREEWAAGKSVTFIHTPLPTGGLETTIRRTVQPAAEPAPANPDLLDVDQARAFCGLADKSRSSWFRFRHRHRSRLRKVGGGLFHRADLINALDAERAGH
jgi:hypothetical protein